MNDVPELSSNDRPLDESSSDDEPLSFEQPLCERPPLREPGRVLRDLADQGTLLVPGAFNALTGMLIQQSGFPATYLSGAAFSAGTLGLPDVGLVTLSELAWQTAILARRLTIPILVDADTGFGGVVNVERTVVELEASGAAAIQLEDQQLPKRCGHLSGKRLVSRPEMVTKLQAACRARRDPHTVIIARTDARAVEGIDEAVRRAEAYLDAGADWIFPEALQTPEEFDHFQCEVDAPLVANMTEFGKSPLLTARELADLGYQAILYPVTTLRVAAKGVQLILDIIASEGTQREVLDLMQTREELYELLGYEYQQGAEDESNECE